MLTLTSEYALRAMIYLAQHEEKWPVPGRTIAAEAGIPAKYLSKILGDLVRAGLLESSPGKMGGFRLERSARKTALYDVLVPFERFKLRRCPFGNPECSEQNPCLAHDRWKKVVEGEQNFLKQTSLHDVAFGRDGQPRRSGKRARVPAR